MSSEAPPPSDVKALPSVQPPSGRFIAQLFLVPGIIVAVAVGLLYGFTWLVGGSRTPEEFLKGLRDPNPEIRWRAASDLSQVLKRDPELAANAEFAGELSELLRQALRDSDQAQRHLRETAARREADPGAAKAAAKAAEDQQSLVQFLMSCLGSFSVPVGVPILSEVALKEEGADNATVDLRRQLAVWALANLGENLKRTHPDQAREALGLDEVFARCAKANNPELRKLVAFALNIWEGTPAENARMEETLLKLSYDDGHGAAEDSRLRGLEIRYKAIEGLARRGSDRVKGRLPVLAEMLDPEQQAANFRVRMRDGKEATDEASVVSTVTSALRAVAELHRRRPDLDLSSLHPAIDRLAHHDNAVFRAEAERTQIALGIKH